MSPLEKALERVALYQQEPKCLMPYQKWMIALADKIERLATLTPAQRSASNV